MLPHIISYLTQAQYINVGLVKVPTSFLSQLNNTQVKIEVTISYCWIPSIFIGFYEFQESQMMDWYEVFNSKSMQEIDL